MKSLSSIGREPSTQYIYFGAEAPDYHLQADDLKNISEKQKLETGVNSTLESNVAERSESEITAEAETRAAKINELFERDDIKDLDDSSKIVIAEKIQAFLEDASSFDSAPNQRTGSFEGLNDHEFSRMSAPLNMEVAAAAIYLNENGSLLMKAVHDVIVKMQENKDNLDWKDSDKFTFSKKTIGHEMVGNVKYQSSIAIKEISGIQFDKDGLFDGDAQLFSKEDIADLNIDGHFIAAGQEGAFLKLLETTLEQNFDLIKYCAQNNSNFDLDAKDRESEIKQQEADALWAEKKAGEDLLAKEQLATEQKESARMTIRDAANDAFVGTVSRGDVNALGVTLEAGDNNHDKVVKIQKGLIAKGQTIKADGWAGGKTEAALVAFRGTNPENDRSGAPAQMASRTQNIVIDSPATTTEPEILRRESPEQIQAKLIASLAEDIANSDNYEKAIGGDQGIENWLESKGLDEQGIATVLEQAEALHEAADEKVHEEFIASAAKELAGKEGYEDLTPKEKKAALKDMGVKRRGDRTLALNEAEEIHEGILLAEKAKQDETPVDITVGNATFSLTELADGVLKEESGDDGVAVKKIENGKFELIAQTLDGENIVIVEKVDGKWAQVKTETVATTEGTPPKKRIDYSA